MITPDRTTDSSETEHVRITSAEYLKLQRLILEKQREIDSLRGVLRLVGEMRASQVSYFKLRLVTDLQDSRKLEKQVDAALKASTADRHPKQPQARLFEG